ncbi:hypothetical protein FA15DRAFT_102643 [Coprinopsis marcescibilis]|uniref:Uncharacterized protein n=1 Tax=Coprinopsis marcescibilis TaxID=230819 RepID=A0A5C3KLM7_COPMA|nr:hypothetical protein FA15DRAFT_102643 [Coprinopsis marcescibilis]
MLNSDHRPDDVPRACCHLRRSRRSVALGKHSLKLDCSRTVYSTRHREPAKYSVQMCQVRQRRRTCFTSQQEHSNGVRILSFPDTCGSATLLFILTPTPDS